MKVVFVLRSGGEYRAEHVARLARQVRWRLPAARIVCLSDVDVPCERTPLRHDWPGWWSKMAMLEDVQEPFLYLDLDTTIVGPLDDIAGRRELTVLSDFYRPEKIQSSLMLVTPEAAAAAWSAFIADPAQHMRECVTRARWGDQGFLEGVWGRDVARWQDVAPGQCVSWKVHCRKAGLPHDARAVVFHGKPRPWDLGLDLQAA